MRTYRELFATPQFGALFGTVLAQIAGATVSGIALGTLVYSATRSPLLSALSMFGPSFAQALGAVTLLSAADRLPPRATLAGLSLFFGLTTAALALPGLPLGAIFGIIAVQGLANCLGGGVRYGLLTQIVPGEGYVLGRSLLNMSVGFMQICGYALGGLLLANVSARGALGVAAALDVVAAVVARTGLRVWAPRVAGRPSIRDTWYGNRLLWSARTRRYIYAALWVPNGLVVGCEALYIPYSPRSASLLFAAAALGMLAGDTVTGRFVPAGLRSRLITPLRFVLAVPYLLFVVTPPVPAAVVAAAVASVGYSATLLLQDRLIVVTPEELHGHALGLHSAGMLTMQAVGAALAGALAQYLPAGYAIAVMAAGSALVSALLTRGLRPPRNEPPAGSDALVAAGGAGQLANLGAASSTRARRPRA